MISLGTLYGTCTLYRRRHTTVRPSVLPVRSIGCKRRAAQERWSCTVAADRKQKTEQTCGRHSSTSARLLSLIKTKTCAVCRLTPFAPSPFTVPAFVTLPDGERMHVVRTRENSFKAVPCVRVTHDLPL